MPLHPPKYAPTLHSALKVEKSCNQQMPTLPFFR